ncbi:hypothetical protein CAL7716_070790 [Calothrix sp. PCC 7716]|nr:hypothetical protein CAL7716_070790 [Calothrix sp. PCC 7716]
MPSLHSQVNKLEMVGIYKDLFIVICLGLLGWGVIRIERIYQYPFFMGSMFTSFILPQAFALISKPEQVTLEALQRVLLVSCLCATACWIGYQIRPDPKWLTKLNTAIDERKLFRAGIVLMTSGLFFTLLLSRTTAATGENGNWSGLATIYLNFSQTTQIALGIFILKFIQRPNIINFICTVFSAWPLLGAVIIGRRQPTMTLLVTIGLSLFWVRRLVPPRILVVIGMLSIAVLIPVLGTLRGDFWNLVFSGKWQDVLAVSQHAFGNQQKGDLLELRNAALVMDAVERTGLFGYGTGWWDSIVLQWVPGQIVGFDFKKSLQFNLWDKYLNLLKDFYGYKNPAGATFTGIGDSFVELSYFGFLSFALIAYIFKHIWISATYYKSTCSRILYLGLVSPAMIALTHSVGFAIQQSSFQLIFIGLALYYSRVKHKYSTEWV